MVEKEIKVINSLGIHARPASMIVQTANKYRCSISLEKDGISADAKSIMSVMMLAAAHNALVIIKAEGEDEQQALEAIEQLFIKKFNEE